LTRWFHAYKRRFVCFRVRVRLRSHGAGSVAISRRIHFRYDPCVQSVREREAWLAKRNKVPSPPGEVPKKLGPGFPCMASVQVQAALHGLFWNHKIDVRPAMPPRWLKNVGELADSVTLRQLEYRPEMNTTQSNGDDSDTAAPVL
jgi:hypothetical protein